MSKLGPPSLWVELESPIQHALLQDGPVVTSLLEFIW